MPTWCDVRSRCDTIDCCFSNHCQTPFELQSVDGQSEFSACAHCTSRNRGRCKSDPSWPVCRTNIAESTRPTIEQRRPQSRPDFCRPIQEWPVSSAWPPPDTQDIRSEDFPCKRFCRIVRSAIVASLPALLAPLRRNSEMRKMDSKTSQVETRFAIHWAWAHDLEKDDDYVWWYQAVIIKAELHAKE